MLEKLVKPIGHEDTKRIAMGLDRKVKSQMNVNGMFSFGLNKYAEKVKAVATKQRASLNKPGLTGILSAMNST